MTNYISYGIYYTFHSKIYPFFESHNLGNSYIRTRIDVIEFLKKVFKRRDSNVILKNLYQNTQFILNDEEDFYSFIKKEIKKELKKYKNKKLKIKYKEMKIYTDTNIKIPKNELQIIYIDRDLLPEFVYIMHNLHAKILKNILDWSPKEIEIIDIDIDKNFDEILLGIKVALEPIFALALFYNSKYVNEPEKTKFFTSYTKFVNKLAVKVNKILDILEINRVDGDILQDFIKEIKKIRCENENLL